MRYHLNGPNLFSCFWLKEVGCWCRMPGVSVSDGLNQAVSQVSRNGRNGCATIVRVVLYFNRKRGLGN